MRGNKLADESVKNESISNQELAKELCKPIIGKFEKQKIYTFFIDNTWSADPADMQLISKFNKGIHFLLCVIDIFKKMRMSYSFGKQKMYYIYQCFSKVLHESNAIEMYSTHNEGEYFVVESLIRILKNKIYKYMTSISKDVYVDKLDGIANKYNNTYHRTIKMNSVDTKTSIYINFDKENNKKGDKKVSDNVRTSKYKNIFVKCYVTNWPVVVFVMKKVKYWTFVISDLNGEEVVGAFYEKELQ